MTSITEYLTGQGYGIPADETVSRLAEWESWYRGYVKDFHRYRIYNGMKYVGRDKLSLSMAKTVCEDWAGLLLNEKVKIYTGTAFDRRLEEVFERNGFRVKGNQLVELAFAYGTGAFVEYLDGGGEVTIDFVRAPMIYPLNWDNGYVSECAFGSARENNGKKQYYIQLHRLNEQGLYIIENHLVDADTGKELSLPDGILPLVETKSSEPLFQIVTPNSVNSVNPDSPFGASVFAEAIPLFKACDTVFDSYVNEFVLGKKRITVPISMAQIKMSESGASQPVFDPNDTVFYGVPGHNGEDERLQEIDLSIRASEHELALNKMLDLIALKCGLGTGRYKFENGTAKTATEVISEKSDLFRTLKKHEIVLENALKGLVKAVSFLLGSDVGEINIDFDDSIIEDKTSERNSDRQDVAMGAMPLHEYRMKWYGEDEATARKMTSDTIAEVIGDDISVSGHSTSESSGNAQVQGKSLNSAQTQSLIAIMSQLSAGTITEGQAINLISTAIGISKDDARKIINGEIE